MKPTLLILIVFYFAVRSAAQNIDAKRDYFWRSGAGYPSAQTTIWDFNPMPTKVDWILKKHSNRGEFGMICNTNGAFLLFSNGCYFIDQKDSIIQNTLNMNTGSIHDAYCPPNGDGYVTAPMCILPYPKDTNAFISFHTRVIQGFNNDADALLMTKLIKDVNNHFKVAFIDSVIIRDKLERGHLAVCRHGNGRDWWIIHPKQQTNQYYKILFSEDRFQKQTQSIGIPSTDYEDSGGQAVFSPDGRKYIRYNVQSDIRIFDFDRCTGLLSNPIHIPIMDAADTIGFAGCALSANSRFLYVISTNNVYQFDLQAPNIANSKMTILTYDHFEDPPGVSIRFGRGLLGADGKIYITSGAGRWFLHTIEYPDSIGIACQAVQRKYQLINSIYDKLPIFPNYRLGTWNSSPCDTLKTGKVGDYDLKLYPNPVVDNLNIDMTLPTYDKTNTVIEILDMVGRPMYVKRMSPFTSIHNVSVSSFANGVYLVCLKVDDHFVISKKITILH